MNGPGYNFFWIYILDLHNNYIEDPRVLKVNQLSPSRMENILEEVLKTEIQKINLVLDFTFFMVYKIVFNRK